MSIRKACISGVVTAVVVFGCIPKQKAGMSPAADTSPEAKSCGPKGLIDDGEDNDHQVTVGNGRGGYWYTFVDKAGSTITPTAGEQGGQFAMSPGGARGSGHAARMTGKVGTGDIVYAGMGLNFTDPKGQYDASQFKGVAFYAKKGQGTGKVRLKVPDMNTDPEGKVCSECFNDFGVNLELSEEWSRYVVPFDSMRQLSGWGSPRVSSIEPSKLYGLQWQVNVPGASYDIWVDDVEFTGCQ